MKTRLSLLLTAFVLAIAMGCAAGGVDPVKVEVAGIHNFSRVEGAPGFAGSRVGLAGATEPSAMPALKSQGYAAVVNLRLAGEDGVDIEASRVAAEAAGLQYIHLPLDAKNATPADVDAVLGTLEEKANQPVYLHCGSATRAAALFMIGRVREDGWTVEQASAEAAQIAGKPDEAVAFATRFLEAQRQRALP
jgi:uncharacterized protein (TIGR01244 family)